jgi:phosphoacetylglucosamine mutase
MSDSPVATKKQKSLASPLKLGVVQTAYANGASTTYLKHILGEENVLIAKTGVKHVHEAAHHNFDIGVYFEANGHGTVLFGDAYYDFLAHADDHICGHVALQRLQLLPALINQAVGDALCDLLLVDAILQIKGWNIQDWNSLYTDLPSRQCKVSVEDRTIILTNTNETECTSPVELQQELNAAMARYPTQARCFVRPSGTENVVRVYAEAQTQQQADELATLAAKIVHSICRGVGEPPVFPSSKM